MSETRTTRDLGKAEPARGVEPRRPGWLAWAGWAGVAGPILFTATYVTQELLRQGEYSPVKETVSALEAGPNGWVQQVNFIVFGLLTITFAAGLHQGVRRSRTGAAGPALVFVSGVGLLLAGAFPLHEDSAGATYDPGGHFVAGTVFFLSSALALVVLSPRLARDPRFENLSSYTLVAGVAGLVAFVVMGAFVIPDDAPLHDWAGLMQRIVILTVLFPCRVILAARLIKALHPNEG
jgi:hypothetical membrane protein